MQTIAPAGKYFGYLTLAANGAGRTVCTWGSDSVNTQFTLSARIRRPDATLGPSFDIDEVPGEVPRAAVDPGGHVIFVWQVNENFRLVRMRRRTAGGGMAPVRTLSSAGEHSHDAHVAVDATGKATVAWYTSPGRWFTKTITLGGVVSPLRELTAPSGP